MHTCLQEQSVGTWSWAAAQRGLLGAAQLCRAAGPFLGPAHPKYHTRCPTHREWQHAFSLGTVTCAQEKQHGDLSNLHEHQVKVRQSPGSSCPTAPMGSTGMLPSLLTALWGMYCTLTVWAVMVAAATRASWQVAHGMARFVPAAHLAMGWAGCQRCSREPVPCKPWRARLLQQEHNSESLPWLVLSRRWEQAASCGIGGHGSSRVRALPLSLCFQPAHSMIWQDRPGAFPPLIIRVLQLQFLAFFFTFFTLST